MNNRVLGWSVLKDRTRTRITHPVRTGPRVPCGPGHESRWVDMLKASIGGRCVLRKSDTGCVGASRTGPGRKSQVPIGDRCAFSEQEVVGGRCAKLDRVENLKYLSGTGVSSRSKKLSGAGVPRMEKKKLSLERTTCLADKTNHPVERLSLNRSQCGSCSTKYDTSAGT